MVSERRLQIKDPDIERRGPNFVLPADFFKALSTRKRTPVTTYRLQLHKGFGFREATAILPYLSRLGITDVYTSPLLKAAPGSRHGYDICDHNLINPELGTASDYDTFVQEMKRLNLSHILDFVPNHMGVYPETNPWWRDVLENGPASAYAHYFDIDWDPIKGELKGKVLLPILGDQYGSVLERGELQLLFAEGTLSLAYYEQRLPINPRQIPDVMRPGLDALKKELKTDPHLQEFLSILTSLCNLPSSLDNEPDRIAERQREKEIARERLSRLVTASPRIATYILESVKKFNGQAGDRKSFDPLHELLEAQNYRLSYWKTASHEINYRRFFDVNQLAGLRMETREVFNATHRLLFDLLGEGRVSSLRLDHPDGLFDPAGYFELLQKTFLVSTLKQVLKIKRLAPAHMAGLEKWREKEKEREPQGLAVRPLYIVAEKILSTGEALPQSWAIDGTSGYTFMNDLNRLFVDSRHATRLKELYGNFTGKRAPFEVVVYASKHLIESTTMASELNVLAHVLNRISEADRRFRDFTLDSLRDALREVVACFPVYRTYVTASGATPNDREVVERAIQRARRRNPAMESSIFDFVRDALLPLGVKDLSDDGIIDRLHFAMKFQQYTGPVQAKGVEDTAFYRYNLLASLNEVGGDPIRFSGSVKEFHEISKRRRQNWPYTMLATATHDTKRGEDVRARLNVLSEIPDIWEAAIREWSQITRSTRPGESVEQLIDPNDEYLLYQTLLGTWPADPQHENRQEWCDRVCAYMNKAIKEAKLRTSWVTPNEDYEKAVKGLIENLLLGERSESFLDAFEPFALKVAQWGLVNSLSQVLIKAASPGVPDFYQGTELWDASLVDPDNRRPVDFKQRELLLTELEKNFFQSERIPEERRLALQQLLTHWPDGRIKLFVTTAILRLRQAHPELFLSGDYLPLEVQGKWAENLLAFARTKGHQSVILVMPRLVAGIESWGDTAILLPESLAGKTWQSVFTREEMSLDLRQGSPVLSAEVLFKHFPVAVLTPDA